jgi:hypothetical protein
MLSFFKSHGTKVLAFMQGSIAAVSGITGIIPDHQLKYWLGASALLVFWRGFVNSANANS